MTAPGNGWFIDFEKNTRQGQAASQKSTPVDSTGTLNIWDLPTYLTAPNAPKLWFDTRQKTVESSHPSQGEHSGGGMQLGSTTPFNVYSSASDVMKQFNAMAYNNPDEFRALQKELFDGGWYSSSSSPPQGGFGKDTESALKTAMLQYLKTSHSAGVAVSFVGFLQHTAQQNLANNPATDSGTTANVPAGPSLTDPNSLKLTVQSAAQTALGRNLTPDELDKFVSQFQGSETNAFSTAQAGGQAYVNPDASAEAIKFVASQHPEEQQQRGIQSYTNAFLNMFLSGSSAPPQIQTNPAAAGI